MTPQPCPCGVPFCVAGGWTCGAYGGDLTLTRQTLIEAFNSWCEEFGWSATALATDVIAAFMMREEPPNRDRLEAESKT